MKSIITLIRVAVGWHFLYEGIIKLFADKWSAASFLNNTAGFLSGFYHWLAASPGRLAVVDFLNVWGLTLIGLALFLGLFVRWSSLAGALLLAMYYFAYPPFGVSLLGSGGSVFVINQLFIEAAILVFFFFYSEKGYGLDSLVRLLWKRKEAASPPAEAVLSVSTRRETLKHLAVLPVLGLAGWGASRSRTLYGFDSLSGATIQLNRVALGELKGELPKGKLGNHELTRLIMGGNLMDGTSHSRDLIYVSSLFKAYNTERKIFETIMLGEQAGIDSISIGVGFLPLLVKYKKLTGSKIKVFVYAFVRENGNDMFADVKKSIDSGAEFIHLIGPQCDKFVRDNQTELIGKMVDEIRRQGCVAGLAAHTIYSLITCEEKGIIPDYYMKTMHHDNYWSAHPRENRGKFEVLTNSKVNPDHNQFHDNLWCPFPDRTIEFVNRTRVPVIGFKVLAAGAIHPKDGFKWAFENGADFICVGMFDFQVVDDVNVCIDTLQNLQHRKRGWYA